MTASAVPTFNEVAAQAHEAFRDKLDGLVVFHDGPVYIAPEVAAQLTKNTAAIKDALKYWQDEMDKHDAPGIAGRNYKLAGTRVNVIALDTTRDATAEFSRTFTKEMRNIAVLDHEIAHYILPNGSSSIPGVSQQLAESAADAYAVLRHIQRFGRKTGYAALLSASQTGNLILSGDTDHYTSDTLDKINQLPEDYIAGLSLHETAALAAKIAGECRLDAPALKGLKEAFRPVRDLYGQLTSGKLEVDDPLETVFAEMLSVMIKHQDNSAIFNAGKRFLNTSGTMTDAARGNPAWEKALAFINAPATTPPPRIANRRLQS